MRKLSLFILVLLFPLVISAEEVIFDWSESFGGSSSEYFDDIIVSSDGYIVVIDSSSSMDLDGLVSKGTRGTDGIIVKYDSKGNVAWKKNWGGSSTDRFNYLIELDNGNYVVVGDSLSTDIDGLTVTGRAYEIIVVCYNKNGDLLWQKSWGGNQIDSVNGLRKMHDDCFAVLGYSTSSDINRIEGDFAESAVFLKYDYDGNLIFEKVWGGNDYDIFDNIYTFSDGSYLVSGHSKSTNIEWLAEDRLSSKILIKHDKNDNVLWGKVAEHDAKVVFNQVITLDDNSFITAGHITFGENIDLFIAKYDKDGELLWDASWGGDGRERFCKVIQVNDGFVIVGESSSTNVDGFVNKSDPGSYGYDIVILKYDLNGNLLWQSSWGGESAEYVNDAIFYKNNTLIIVGKTSSKNIPDLLNNGSSDGIILFVDKNGLVL